MALFRKKKKQNELPNENNKKIEIEIPDPCTVFGHIYRDFPPFLKYSWNGKSDYSTISIQEYYICTRCKNRQTMTLLSRSYKGYDQDYFFDQIKELKKEYKEILKPEAIVEDMVNDTIMVDRQKLKFWDQLHSPDKLDKEPFTFKLNDRPYGELIDPDEEED